MLLLLREKNAQCKNLSKISSKVISSLVHQFYTPSFYDFHKVRIQFSVSFNVIWCHFFPKQHMMEKSEQKHCGQDEIFSLFAKTVVSHHFLLNRINRTNSKINENRYLSMNIWDYIGAKNQGFSQTPDSK